MKWEDLRKDRNKGIKPDLSPIKQDAKEVVFDLVSCMCDNKNRLVFKQKEDGEFRVFLLGGNGISHALSNLQMKGDYLDLTWKADQGNWTGVAKIIETGTSLIAYIMSR
ncbi:MAG: hypothetical protein P9L97_05785 [Candidatus Tenebribacter davisii]|nr:hypothetical protein [Candidatus Tenebribacter davisii]